MRASSSSHHHPPPQIPQPPSSLRFRRGRWQPAGKREEMLPSPKKPSAGGRWREAGMGRSGMMCWKVVACPQAASCPGTPPPGGGNMGGHSGDKATAPGGEEGPSAPCCRCLGGVRCTLAFHAHLPQAPHASSPATLAHRGAPHPAATSAGEGWGPAGTRCWQHPPTTTPLLHPPLPSSTRQRSCLLVNFFFLIWGGGWAGKMLNNAKKGSMMNRR